MPEGGCEVAKHTISVTFSEEQIKEKLSKTWIERAANKVKKEILQEIKEIAESMIVERLESQVQEYIKAGVQDYATVCFNRAVRDSIEKTTRRYDYSLNYALRGTPDDFDYALQDLLIGYLKDFSIKDHEEIIIERMAQNFVKCLRFTPGRTEKIAQAIINIIKNEDEGGNE